MRYEFIEIGTSNFDTLIQSCSDSTFGISVEPIRYYLDRLPNKPYVRKVCAAISNVTGTVDVYYVPESIIEQQQLPFWLRGCNSINDYHRLHGVLGVKNLVVKEPVPVYPLSKLFIDNYVTELDLLKIDTEGHDSTIMLSFYGWAVNNVLPNRIIFESNEWTDPIVVKTIIDLYSSHYKVVKSGYDTQLQRI